MAEPYEPPEPIRGPHVPEPRSETYPVSGRHHRDDRLDPAAGGPAYDGAHADGGPYADNGTYADGGRYADDHANADGGGYADNGAYAAYPPSYQDAPHPVPGPLTPPARGAERVRAQSTVPRWLGRLPYAFVLCGVAAGLAVVATNHFRRGSMLIAASVFIGALARLILPESQVGLLAVRRRWLDVLLMTAAAVGITLVAFVAKGTSG